MRDVPSLHVLLADWRLWMESGNMSARTVADRAAIIDLFARRTGADPLTCDWRAIAGFLTSYERTSGTRSTYRSALHAFYAWLIAEGLREDNPTDRLPRERAPRRAPRPITTAQLGSLLGSGIYRRTRMMILLAAFAGLRVSEIAKITGEDTRAATLWVVGKGDKEAALPIHSYIASEAHRLSFPNHGLWFPSPMPAHAGKPVSGKSVSTTISQAMTRAGVPGTPHALRHWYGSTLRRGGVDLRMLQELMRHADLRSTQIYTEVTPPEMAGAVETLPVPLHAVGQRRGPCRAAGTGTHLAPDLTELEHSSLPA